MSVKKKPNNFKRQLIESIKIAGQMMIDKAADIAGECEYVSDLNVSFEFDPEFRSIPEMTIRRSHLPSKEKMEHLLAVMDENYNPDEDPLKKIKKGHWVITHDMPNFKTVVKCSECGNTHEYDGMIDRCTVSECSECGARMVFNV